MNFKAKLNFMFYEVIDNTKHNSEIYFNFTRSQIFYSHRNRNWFLKEFKINDGDYYELKVNDNVDPLKRYEIIINKNKPIKLILDTKNEFLLKWTHKLYYIQKDSSNWLRTAIINLIVGITMYFIGQFIGFRSGYQDGLTKAQQEIQAPVQTQTKK